MSNRVMKGFAPACGGYGGGSSKSKSSKSKSSKSKKSKSKKSGSKGGCRC